MAQQSRPPPIIPLGTWPKEVGISSTYWYPGHLTLSEAFLIGEVTAATSQAHQSASEILLEETCTLRLKAMYGTTAELAGATAVRLDSLYRHDTYEQLEPDWGVYRHLKKGQRVLVMVHRYEDAPAVGSRAVIVLNEDAKALPDILRRTGFDASRFTAADLAVLHAASPLFHGEVVAVADTMKEMRHDHAMFLNRLVGVFTALFFAAILGVDHYRRFRTPPHRNTAERPSRPRAG